MGTTLRYPDRQVGSRKPAFPVVVLDGGVPVDLTTWAAFQFRMVPVQAGGGGTPKIDDEDATAVDDEGHGEYLAAAGELDTEGEFECQWLGIDDSGVPWKSPIIYVRICRNP